MEVLNALAQQGYAVEDAPADGDALMQHLMAGPTNAAVDARTVRENLALEDYQRFFDGLPKGLRDAVIERWGRPQDDPFYLDDVKGFALPLSRMGRSWSVSSPRAVTISIRRRAITVRT